MLSSDDLYKLAKCRYEEAKVLAKNNKPDGATYLCGYALELILKRRISLHLDWSDGYPENNNDFNKKQSFKTHDLGDLLHLSGLEQKIKKDVSMFAYWQIAKTWQVEQRYKRVGEKNESEMSSIIDATREVLNWIIKHE